MIDLILAIGLYILIVSLQLVACYFGIYFWYYILVGHKKYKSFPDGFFKAPRDFLKAVKNLFKED